MKLPELFLQQYFFELEYKDNVLNKLQVILAIYITGFSAMAYMVKMATQGKTFAFFCYSTNYVNVFYVFYVFVILTVVCYSISFVYFVKNMIKHKVKYLPYFSDILKYRKDLFSHYHNKKNKKASDFEEKFNNYFLEQLAICNDHNHKINRLRVRKLRLSFIFAIVASLTLLISGTIFVLADLDASSPSKIERSFDSNSPMVKSLNTLSDKLNREGMNNE